MKPNDSHTPVRHMSVVDGICVIVGIVVGAGIFRAPSVVAGCTGSAGTMMLAWLVGGLLCLCGALCYAELATTYPRVGGEYVYLHRAFGGAVSFLFVWARASVIQTGAIAAMAYVFGDYASGLMGWSHPAPTILALLATVGLTFCNAIGLRASKWTQNLLTVAKVGGLAAVVLVGLLAVRPPTIANPAAVATTVPAAAAATTAPVATAAALATAPAGNSSSAWPSFSALGLAMVFVLYTFGGWSESAYVAGEMRRRRRIIWVLVGSVGAITALYLAVNAAYLRVLGIGGMAASEAVAADAMKQALGDGGRIAVSVLVAVSALGALDGNIFTGSRAICALGDDYATFRFLGRWHGRFRTPANAIAVQGAVAAILVILPALPWFRKALGAGFNTAVEYTAPAFWTFLLLTGIALFVLRVREPHVKRPFRVPLLPITGPLFCLMSAWMLYSSLDYRRGGALVGVIVLLAGVPLYLLVRRRTDAA